MKKVAVYSLLVLFLTSFSSCFLFKTHEDCPAYGDLEKEKQTEQTIAQIQLNEDKA